MFMLGSVAKSSINGCLPESDAPYGVKFDGTNDYLYTTSMNAIGNSTKLTMSLWFQFDNIAADKQFVVHAGSLGSSDYKLYFQYLQSTDKLLLFVRNSFDITVLQARSTGTISTTGSWNHVMLSVDLSSTSSRHFYLNGTSGVTWEIYNTAYSMSFQKYGWFIGTWNGSSQFINGDIADFYIAPDQYIDLSDSSNREKFYKDGSPVYLGRFGSNPTGVAPLIYLRNDYDSFEINEGAGSSDFTVSGGGLTDAADDPSNYSSRSPQAVVFDGTNDYITTTSGVVGLSNGKAFTLSVWVYVNAFSGGNESILWFTNGDTYKGWVDLTSTGTLGRFRLGGRDTSDTLQWNIRTTNSVVSASSWHHILFSCDAAASTYQLYVNDSNISTWDLTTFNNVDIDWDDRCCVGAIDYESSPDGNKFGGEMSEMWWDNTYLDLSVEANRRKFISSNGRPAYLGSDGSIPTGSQPKIFFTGEASVWNAGTNAGTGGNFATSGSVLDSSNEPVELP